MDAFLISTSLVALAEIGDKTQLLAFILAARFQKPVPIIAGIFVATLINHGLAASLGVWVSAQISPEYLRVILGVIFLIMAAWILVPDKCTEDDAKISQHSVFLATFIAFFIAEMGDKTQIATIILAADYQSILPVLIGTTLGMLIANVPAVILGARFAGKISTPLVRKLAALLFVVLAMLTFSDLLI